jgi:hypothetical protein
MLVLRVIKNGSKYPGLHNQSTQRTNPFQKPLEPKAQMLIVWRGLVTYLDQQLRQGKSVNIQRFGAFTFDIATELPKIATKELLYSTNSLGEARAERKHIHHLK